MQGSQASSCPRAGVLAELSLAEHTSGLSPVTRVCGRGRAGCERECVYMSAVTVGKLRPTVLPQSPVVLSGKAWLSSCLPLGRFPVPVLPPRPGNCSGDPCPQRLAQPSQVTTLQIPQLDAKGRRGRLCRECYSGVGHCPACFKHRTSQWESPQISRAADNSVPLLVGLY